MRNVPGFPESIQPDCRPRDGFDAPLESGHARGEDVARITWMAAVGADSVEWVETGNP